MKRNIIVVGSINTDLVIHAPRMPQKGETLSGSGFFTAHGGKGANQAVAAARAGGSVCMCGCVGADAFGESAVSALVAEGIRPEVRRVENIPSGTAVIAVTGGDNRIILDSGANALLSEEDIDRVLAGAKEGDIYLTQLENPVGIIGYGMRRAKEKGMFVILNPAPADGEIADHLAWCDLLIPNETEAEILNADGKLEKMYSGALIVTLGDKGFALKQDGVIQTYACPKVKAVDTTAAGDTFCGALAAKLAEGCDLLAAARFGSAAASLACTGKGAQPSIPRVEQVEKFLAEPARGGMI